MWYNDILIIVMGVIALLMIIMAVMVGSRVPKKRPEKPIEEKKPETILVERGFENHTQKKPAYETEEEEYRATFMKPEEPEELKIMEPEPSIEPEEPPEETIVEAEPEPMMEPEPVIEPEPEPIPEETEDDSIEITPTEPIIIETTEEPEEQPTIITTEPIIIETTETEYTAPSLEGSPSIPELEEDNVVITPNETFYDPTPEESEPLKPVGEPPELEEENEDIQEEELPEIEEESTEPAPEEIEPNIEEPPEPEPVIPEKPVRLPMRRIRKPIIDESDPDLKIDLGVETCPHCGSKVPDTIYCIYCGKPLDPTKTPGLEEEEEEKG